MNSRGENPSRTAPDQQRGIRDRLAATEATVVGHPEFLELGTWAGQGPWARSASARERQRPTHNT